MDSTANIFSGRTASLDVPTTISSNESTSASSLLRTIVATATSSAPLEPSQQLPKSSDELWKDYDTALRLLKPSLATAGRGRHVTALMTYVHALLKEEEPKKVLGVLQSTFQSGVLKYDSAPGIADAWVRAASTAMDSFESALEQFTMACQLNIPLYIASEELRTAYCMRLSELSRRTVMTAKTALLLEKFLSNRDIAIACRDELTGMLLDYYDEVGDDEIEKKFSFLVNHASITPLRRYFPGQIKRDIARGNLSSAMRLISLALKQSPPFISASDATLFIDAIATKIQTGSQPHIRAFFEIFRKDMSISPYLLSVGTLRLESGRFDEAVDWLKLIKDTKIDGESIWEQLLSNPSPMSQLIVDPNVYFLIPTETLEQHIAAMLTTPQHTDAFFKSLQQTLITDTAVRDSFLAILARNHQPETFALVSKYMERYFQSNQVIPSTIDTFYSRAFPSCDGGLPLYRLLAKFTPSVPLVLAENSLASGELPQCVEEALIRVTSINRLKKLPNWRDSDSLVDTAYEALRDILPAPYFRSNGNSDTKKKKGQQVKQAKPIFSPFLRGLELLLSQRTTDLDTRINLRYVCLKELRAGFKVFSKMNPDEQQRFLAMLKHYFALNWDSVHSPIDTVWTEACLSKLFQEHGRTGLVLHLMATRMLPTREEPYTTSERMSCYEEAIRLAEEARTSQSLLLSSELSHRRLADSDLNLLGNREAMAAALAAIRRALDLMVSAEDKERLLTRKNQFVASSLKKKLNAGTYDKQQELFFQDLLNLRPLFLEGCLFGSLTTAYVDLLAEGRKRWPTSEIETLCKRELIAWINALKEAKNSATPSIEARPSTSSSSSY